MLSATDLIVILNVLVLAQAAPKLSDRPDYVTNSLEKDLCLTDLKSNDVIHTQLNRTISMLNKISLPFQPKSLKGIRKSDFMPKKHPTVLSKRKCILRAEKVQGKLRNFRKIFKTLKLKLDRYCKDSWHYARKLTLELDNIIDSIIGLRREVTSYMNLLRKRVHKNLAKSDQAQRKNGRHRDGNQRKFRWNGRKQCSEILTISHDLLRQLIVFLEGWKSA